MQCCQRRGIIKKDGELSILNLSVIRILRISQGWQTYMIKILTGRSYVSSKNANLNEFKNATIVEQTTKRSTPVTLNSIM